MNESEGSTRDFNKLADRIYAREIVGNRRRSNSDDESDRRSGCMCFSSFIVMTWRMSAALISAFMWNRMVLSAADSRDEIMSVVPFLEVLLNPYLIVSAVALNNLAVNFNLANPRPIWGFIKQQFTVEENQLDDFDATGVAQMMIYRQRCGQRFAAAIGVLVAMTVAIFGATMFADVATTPVPFDERNGTEFAQLKMVYDWIMNTPDMALAYEVMFYVVTVPLFLLPALLITFQTVKNLRAVCDPVADIENKLQSFGEEYLSSIELSGLGNQWQAMSNVYDRDMILMLVGFRHKRSLGMVCSAFLKLFKSLDLFLLAFGLIPWMEGDFRNQHWVIAVFSSVVSVKFLEGLAAMNARCLQSFVARLQECCRNGNCYKSPYSYGFAGVVIALLARSIIAFIQLYPGLTPIPEIEGGVLYECAHNETANITSGNASTGWRCPEDAGLYYNIELMGTYISILEFNRPAARGMMLTLIGALTWLVSCCSCAKDRLSLQRDELRVKKMIEQANRLGGLKQIINKGELKPGLVAELSWVLGPVAKPSSSKSIKTMLLINDSAIDISSSYGPQLKKFLQKTPVMGLVPRLRVGLVIMKFMMLAGAAALVTVPFLQDGRRRVTTFADLSAWEYGYYALISAYQLVEQLAYWCVVKKYDAAYYSLNRGCCAKNMARDADLKLVKHNVKPCFAFFTTMLVFPLMFAGLYGVDVNINHYFLEPFVEPSILRQKIGVQNLLTFGVSLMKAWLYASGFSTLYKAVEHSVATARISTVKDRVSLFPLGGVSGDYGAVGAHERSYNYF